MSSRDTQSEDIAVIKNDTGWIKKKLELFIQKTDSNSEKINDLDKRVSDQESWRKTLEKEMDKKFQKWIVYLTIALGSFAAFLHTILVRGSG